MSEIYVEFLDFGTMGSRSVRKIYFTKLDLFRAAIAAGRNPRRPRIGPVYFDLRSRVDCIRSSVVFSPSTEIQATTYFKGLGPSAKADKSEILGNAICALIAEKHLRLPWLIDIENPSHHYHITPIIKRNGRRNDYIGRTSSGKWYAFEAKGRSRQPGPSDLNKWKTQANMVEFVNMKPINAGIVSAAFVKSTGEIRAFWKDPPPDSGLNLVIPNISFFKLYYEEILEVLRGENVAFKVNNQELVSLPKLGILIGLHSEVRSALQNNQPSAIINFASRRYESSLTETQRAVDGMQIFPDGLLMIDDTEGHAIKAPDRLDPSPADKPKLISPKSISRVVIDQPIKIKKAGHRKETTAMGQHNPSWRSAKVKAQALEKQFVHVTASYH
jgi:hypothetical protein